MNLFSCLRMPVDINTWRASIGLFGNVTIRSSTFYLTTCFRCILYSILLLITSLFLLFTVHLYDNDLRMRAFLSLHVNLINIKGSFLNKLAIKCCICPHVHMFFCPLLLFISVILLLLSGDIYQRYCYCFLEIYISDIVTAFWRYISVILLLLSGDIYQ